MLLAALVPLALLTASAPAATAPAAPAADPIVRVTLNHRSYERGDRARVTVWTRDDGYLVVLHVEPGGRIRVLFPLDPGDDNFIRGQRDYEIRSRGDREAFQVDAYDGTGTVYAAVSRDPFHFDEFVRGDHWDYRVLDDSLLPRDPEVGLTNLVQRMAGSSHFDYDIVTYDVGRSYASTTTDYPEYYPAYYPVYYPVFAAYPVYRSCFFDPFFDPWCRGFYYPRTFISINLIFGRSHRYGGFGPYRPCYFACGPTYIGWYPRARPPHYGWPHSPWEGGSSGPGLHYRPRLPERTPDQPMVSPLYTASRFAVNRRPMVTQVGERSPRIGGTLVTREGWSRESARGASPRTPDVIRGGVRMDPRASEPEAGGARRMELPRTFDRREPREVQRGLRPTNDPVRAMPRDDDPRIVRPRGELPRVEVPNRSDPDRYDRGMERRAEPRVEPRPEPRAAPRGEPRAQPRAEPRGEARSAPSRPTQGGGGGGGRRPS